MVRVWQIGFYLLKLERTLEGVGTWELEGRLGEDWDDKTMRRALDALIRRGHTYPQIRAALQQLRHIARNRLRKLGYVLLQQVQLQTHGVVGTHFAFYHALFQLSLVILRSKQQNTHINQKTAILYGPPPFFLYTI